MTQEKIIIDGKNAILGRVASYAAQQILRGKQVIIVNSEKIIVTGNRLQILDNYSKKKELTGSNQKGPRHTFSPEKIMKRAVRGMIPNHKGGRGRSALKDIKCYNDVPSAYEKDKKITMEKDNVMKSISLLEVAKAWKG